MKTFGTVIAVVVVLWVVAYGYLSHTSPIIESFNFKRGDFVDNDFLTYADMRKDGIHEGESIVHEHAPFRLTIHGGTRSVPAFSDEGERIGSKPSGCSTLIRDPKLVDGDSKEEYRLINEDELVDGYYKLSANFYSIDVPWKEYELMFTVEVADCERVVTPRTAVIMLKTKHTKRKEPIGYPIH